jgi:hypothetical protein
MICQHSPIGWKISPRKEMSEMDDHDERKTVTPPAGEPPVHSGFVPNGQGHQRSTFDNRQS